MIVHFACAALGKAMPAIISAKPTFRTAPETRCWGIISTATADDACVRRVRARAFFFHPHRLVTWRRRTMDYPPPFDVLEVAPITGADEADPRAMSTSPSGALQFGPYRDQLIRSRLGLRAGAHSLPWYSMVATVNIEMPSPIKVPKIGASEIGGPAMKFAPGLCNGRI